MKMIRLELILITLFLFFASSTQKIVIKNTKKVKQKSDNNNEIVKALNHKGCGKKITLKWLSDDDTIAMPDILLNEAKYFGKYNELVESTNNNMKAYHQEVIGNYLTKFVFVYLTIWYYYYDMLYEKVGIFFNKYKKPEQPVNKIY